jgi:hypothetical protein
MAALAFEATLVVLSEPILRGSLANARQALDERRAQELAFAAWQPPVERAAHEAVADPQYVCVS